MKKYKLQLNYFERFTMQELDVFQTLFNNYNQLIDLKYDLFPGNQQQNQRKKLRSDHPQKRFNQSQLNQQDYGHEKNADYQQKNNESSSQSQFDPQKQDDEKLINQQELALNENYSHRQSLQSDFQLLNNINVKAPLLNTHLKRKKALDMKCCSKKLKLKNQYPTKNFLIIFKNLHLKQAKDKLGDDYQNSEFDFIRNIQNKKGISKSDFLTLYEHPMLEGYYDQLFKEINLREYIEKSKCKPTMRKVALQRMHIFEIAFRTKSFPPLYKDKVLVNKAEY